MRQFTGSDSMLMQLPTPEDCISSTARCAAQPGAGGERDAFLFGGQHDGAHVGVRVRRFDQMRVAGVWDVAEQRDTCGLQRGVDLRLPGGWGHEGYRELKSCCQRIRALFVTPAQAGTQGATPSLQPGFPLSRE